MSYCQQCADLERMLRASEKRNNMLRAQYAHMALKHNTAQAEVATLRAALERMAAAGQCCEAANVGKPHDSECVARAALQAVEET